MIVHTVKKVTAHKSSPPGRHINIFVGCAAADTKYRDMLVFGRQRWEFYTSGTIDFIDSLAKADCAMIVVTENTAKDQQTISLINDIFTRGLPVAGVDVAKHPTINIPEKLQGSMIKYGWEWFAEFIDSVANKNP